MSDDIESLRRQLAEAEENLRLIQERKAQYVQEVDIPLQLIKDERRLEAQTTDLRERLESCKIPSPDHIIWEKDGKEMVRVPAGTFLYGDEKKERYPPEFWMDKTPVTNAEYARFVVETDHEWPRHWKGKTSPITIADHPVTNVSWHDAVAYAEWAGKRLPIEEEWEKAARGTDGRKYPWGDQTPTPELCNFGGSEGSTTPVGKYSPQGDSPYGCVDMAGNVWEWTASDYETGGKVQRGGSWGTNGVYCASRGRSHSNFRYDSGGFRCAWYAE